MPTPAEALAESIAAHACAVPGCCDYGAWGLARMAQGKVVEQRWACADHRAAIEAWWEECAF